MTTSVPRGAELQRAVEQIRWFHQIDLGGGVVTPGEYDPAGRLEELKLPESLAGRTVLDIGAWDGYFSFAAERRGASRVLATDSLAWEGKGWGTKEGFELARRALGSQVEDRNIDVLDVSADELGRFDVVLLLGVLYHMRHPMLALERVFDVSGKLLVLETHVDMLFGRRPAAAFYGGDELNRDSSNWWGPNPRALVAMLRAVGFARVEVVTRHHLPRIAVRGAYLALQRRNPILSSLRQDRVVVHAWR